MLSNFVRRVNVNFHNGIVKRYRSYKKNVHNTLKRHSEEALAKSQETNMQRMTKDHLNELSEKLKKSAPRVGTLLAIGTTVPSFYFLYNLVWENYNSEKFYKSIKQGVDWINYLNAFCAAAYFGLEAVRFSDRAAKTKWVAPRFTYVLVLIPFFLSLGSLSFHDTLHRHILLPTLGNEVALLLLESMLVNQNLIPYWFFDIKYRLHVFTLMIIASYHYAMKHLGQDVANQPEKYQGENAESLPLSLRP